MEGACGTLGFSCPCYFCITCFLNLLILHANFCLNQVICLRTLPQSALPTAAHGGGPLCRFMTSPTPWEVTLYTWEPNACTCLGVQILPIVRGAVTAMKNRQKSDKRKFNDSIAFIVLIEYAKAPTDMKSIGADFCLQHLCRVQCPRRCCFVAFTAKQPFGYLRRPAAQAVNYLLRRTSFSYFSISSNQFSGTPARRQYSFQISPKGRVLTSS